MDSSSPRIAKICIIGDSGVGKTCLRSRYLNGSFQLGYKATIGADFLSRVVEVDGDKISVSIWDTAGQDRFRSLGTSFYRGSDALILVYSLTSSSSLNSLSTWFEEFKARCPIDDEEDFAWVCVGSKSDLEEERQVGEEEAERVLEGLVGRGSRDEVEGYQVEQNEQTTTNAIKGKTKSTSHTPLHECTSSSSAKNPNITRTSIGIINPPSRTRRKKSSKTTDEPTDPRTSIYHTPQSSQSSPAPAPATDSSTASLRSSLTPAEEEEEPFYTHAYEEEVDMDRQRESSYAQSRGIDVWMSSSPPRVPESVRGEKWRWRDRIEGLIVDENDDEERMGDGGESNEESKEDQEQEQQVDYAKDGIKHFVASAKDGSGVQETFEYLFRRIKAKWVVEDRKERERGQAGKKVELEVGEGRKGWKEACCT